MCVLILSTFLSEIAVFLRIQLDIVINMKYSLFLSDFNETWAFSIGFLEVRKNKI